MALSGKTFAGDVPQEPEPCRLSLHSQQGCCDQPLQLQLQAEQKIPMQEKEREKQTVLPMCPVSSDYRLPAAHIKAQALPHAIAACESPQASHDELHMWHMGQTHAPGRLHAPGAHMAAAGTPWSLCMGFWHAASTPAG